MNTTKIDDMCKIIEKEITSDMKNSFNSVSLQYLDITLKMYINNDEKEKYINIKSISRGHYVRKYPHHSIGIARADENNPASDKGDGALFLALTVLNCDKNFDINYWLGDLNDWWWNKGVCTIKDACTKTEKDGREYYKIDNDSFINWSNNILKNYSPNHFSGGKRKKNKHKSYKNRNKNTQLKTKIKNRIKNKKFNVKSI